MCGLVAIAALSRDGPPVDREWLTRAVRALAHRGPDGETTWIAPDERVALGHRRLAIIDRVGGAQPFTNEDGSVVAVVNGEIYGYERLRDDLAERGHALRTRCDGEVLVHLWEERGAAMVDELEGELAFVLWDARTRTLVASRDRFGVKPLCWAVHEGALWIASEAKALIAAGVPSAWDVVALRHALSLQYPPPARTLFAGIQQVEAGCRLWLVDGAAPRVERWWDLDLLREDEPRSGDAAEVRAALEEAVARRLRAEVPVAVQLSGGVDSAAVLGLAMRHSARPLTAFTLGFEDAAYDEVARAAAMAAHAGAPHEVVRVRGEDLADVWAEAVAMSEGFAINGHLAAKYLLHRAMRAAGFGVVLTGEGADEVFLGYPHFRRDLWRATGDPRLATLAATNRASRGIMLPAGEGLSTRAVAARLGVVPSFLDAKAAMGRRAHALLRADEARAGRDAYAEMIAALDVDGQLAGRSPVEQAQYVWAKLVLPGYLLRTLGDGTEMPHAIEGRLPFLDGALFAVARRSAVTARIADGVEKRVLRDAVRDVVTPEIFAREKHPLMAPPLVRLDRLRARLVDEVRSAALERQPLLDAAKVRAWVDGLGALDDDERAASDPVVMLVLSVIALGERYRL